MAPRSQHRTVGIYTEDLRQIVKRKLWNLAIDDSAGELETVCSCFALTLEGVHGASAHDVHPNGPFSVG